MSSAPAPSEMTRIEAFSDGVFAIAITLLVLDIRVPKTDDVAALAASAGLSAGAALARKLQLLWPHLLAYFLSFAVILVIWVNHHRIFTLVRKSDQTFMFLNGILLLVITFIPFPTALLSEYMSHGDPGQLRVATVVYSGHGLLIALAFQVMWRYAIHKDRLLLPNHDRATVVKIHEQYRWGPAAYVVALVLAFFYPWASIALSLALVIFFSVLGILWRKGR
jgi:uncharacterized membrane protein